MAEVAGNVGIGEAENVGNPLIPPMEIIENVEVEEAENVRNPLNPTMENPPMVDEARWKCGESCEL